MGASMANPFWLWEAKSSKGKEKKAWGLRLGTLWGQPSWAEFQPHLGSRASVFFFGPWGRLEECTSCGFRNKSTNEARGLTDGRWGVWSSQTLHLWVYPAQDHTFGFPRVGSIPLGLSDLTHCCWVSQGRLVVAETGMDWF